MNSNYHFHIELKNDRDQALELRPKARVVSCLWRDVELYLLADRDGSEFGWSCIQVEALIEGKPKNPDYGTTKGLKKRFRLSTNIVINFKEALGCYEHGYYQASVVISRRLLEQVLISKGATPKQRICDMIKELTKQGVLDDKLSNLADDIKYLGNFGAHIKEENANKSDAEQALHFADFLISWLFGKVREYDRAE